MSIAEDIALDLADLPTAPFDVEGPDFGERELRNQKRSERGWGATPPRTAVHGIDDASPPMSAPVSHPLLDGS